MSAAGLCALIGVGLFSLGLYALFLSADGESAMAKRVIIYGNMPYKEITNPETQKSFKITYWDLWFAIVFPEPTSLPALRYLYATGSSYMYNHLCVLARENPDSSWVTLSSLIWRFEPTVRLKYEPPCPPPTLGLFPLGVGHNLGKQRAVFH